MKLLPDNDIKVLANAPPRALNFLLVDDDEICLFIHRRVLELSGYCKSARAVTNGRTALEAVTSALHDGGLLPDVILLDLEMPLMNGIAFLEAFSNLHFPAKRQIAIVLLTSSVSEKDRRYAMSLGAKHYLTKPLTIESLNAVICSLYGYHSPSPLMCANR